MAATITRMTPEAARAELEGQYAAAVALAERLDAEIGALALAVVLGEAPDSDLAAAREDRELAGARVAELEAARVALGVLDEEEAQAAAARERKADEAERERLRVKRRAASAQLVVLVSQLATVFDEAVTAETGDVRIAHKLGETARATVAADAGVLVLAKLPGLAPHLGAGYARPDAGEAAARRLRAD